MKLLFIWIALVLSAWGSIGNVMALKGEASLERAGSVMNVQNAMEILAGDTIVTQTKARVQVMLHDNTVVTIGGDSSFAFKSFAFDGTKNSHLSMEASRGFFRTVTGEIGKVAPERFKVKTASATIGIRGTDFSGEIFEKKEIIRCFEGKIYVDFEEQIRDLDAGSLLELLRDTMQMHEMKMGTTTRERKFESPAAEEIFTATQEPITEDIADINQILQQQESEYMHHYQDITGP